MSAPEMPLDGSAPTAGVPEPAPHVLISAANGAGKGSWNWREVIEQLPEDWQVVVMDGKAPRPRPSRRVDETWEEVERCD